MFRTLTVCRLCGGEFDGSVLKLIDTALANELYPSRESALKAEKFPLEIVICKLCSHIQLKTIIDAKRLFQNYIYKSGTSETFRKHFFQLALEIRKSIKPGEYVLEVGSNDGTLLESLKSLEIKNLGLEPSSNLVNECINKNLNAMCGYLDSNSTSLIINKFGKAGIVVGNNVFAHIDDLNSALRNVHELLTEKGIFIFEVSHVMKMFNKNLFDMIYHEHMSYHSLYSLNIWLKNNGFKLFDVQEIDTHGGSIRVFASKDQTLAVENSVKILIEKENESGVLDSISLKRLGDYIKEKKENLIKLVRNEPSVNLLYGYGAPAKVVTFLSEMGLETLSITGIIDDNVDKQGLFLPGSGIPILSFEEIATEIAQSPHDAVCFIFSWNLSIELETKLKSIMPPGSRAYTFFPTLKEVMY